MEIPDKKAAVVEERKEIKKEGTQKEGPLCSIDGHPPNPEVRVHPGECSKGQSQVWKQFCTS